MGLWRVGVDEPARVAMTVPDTGDSLTFGELFSTRKSGGSWLPAGRIGGRRCGRSGPIELR